MTAAGAEPALSGRWIPRKGFAMEEKELLKRLKERAEDGLKKYQTPSVGIGIIKDGKVVFSGGFGLRDMKNKLPVDGQTNYMIGSCSKAFTAALIGVLVSEGKLDLDTPIRKYVPEVRFYDDLVTRDVTLRDIMSHRTGLPRHDMSKYGTETSRAESVKVLADVKPNKPFRHTFQYNNICFVLAGYIIEKVTGMTWEKALDKYIFKPLGMNRSYAFMKLFKEDPNHALPYGHKGPRFAPTGIKTIDYTSDKLENYEKGIGLAIGPAGSIESCTDDMLKWVQFFLDNGKVGKKQLIKPEVMAELVKPNTFIYEGFGEMTRQAGLSTFTGYALGWFVEIYRGVKIIYHGGNIDGYSANTGFVPSLNLGFGIYTNMDGTYLRDVLLYEIIDMYLDKDDNWIDAGQEFLKKMIKMAEEGQKKFLASQVKGTSPSHPLKDYTGVYKAPAYCDVTVKLKGKKLAAFMGSTFLDIDLLTEHFHYDTFITAGNKEEILNGLPVQFRTGLDGKVRSVLIPLNQEPGAEPIEFVKVPEAPKAKAGKPAPKAEKKPAKKAK